MKVWTKIKLKDQNKKTNMISHSFTSYIYNGSPLNSLKEKYNIIDSDINELYKYTTNRIAGLILLLSTKDMKRINDIANKYNTNNTVDVLPEIECYMDK